MSHQYCQPNYEMYANIYLVRLSLYFCVLTILLLYWKAVLNDTKYSYATVFNIIPLTKSICLDEIDNGIDRKYSTNVTDKSNTTISNNDDKIAKMKPIQKKDPKLKYVLEIMRYGKWKMILGTKRFKGLYVIKIQ